MIYIELLFESHFYLIVVLIIIYIIEKSLGIMIIFFWFKHTKSPIAARGTASREAALYFLYNILFAVFKMSNNEQNSENFNWVIWILIILVLAIFLRILYLKYQGVDKNHVDYYKYFSK